ncbi:hypothetical protein [Nocardiopsis synnemataformans]|uniref:hypothetical protein n=1 Tax=Nocardiopsis synnemataformans TaxID=61305 RepID=UPI003EBA5E2F
MSDAEQSTPEFAVKLLGSLPKASREALEPHEAAMFSERGGEWIVIARLGHKSRQEDIRTDGEYDYVLKTTLLKILELEVISSPDSEAAYAMLNRSKERRTRALQDAALHDEGSLFQDAR